MSEYRRFFSYIYAYEQDQKTANTGFVKIEMRGPMTTIELHMRGAVLPAPSAYLYLFVRNDDTILGFPLGEVPFTGGNANRRFTLNHPKLHESRYTISDVAGILLLADEKICFVSQWDEAPINWNNFHIYEADEPTAAEPVTDPLEEKVIQSTELPEPQQKIPIFAVRSAPSVFMKTDDMPPEKPFSEKEETSNQTSPASHTPWQETWQKLCTTLPLMHPFSNQNIRCVRVELKDLRLLPPSNWHLCNNSFLLHSFFTYRHLIFGEIPSAKDHKWFIGVPGIRYRQEHVLAAIFGFSDFLPDKESNDADAPFGYWYVSMTEAD